MGILDGKIAVVTGGASGIGRAAALQCAAAGARIVIADVQDGSDVVRQARTQQHEIGFHRTDVSRADEVADLMRHTVAQHGRLDIVIAAAGISGGNCSTAEYTEADFDRVIAINLKGVFLTMKYAIPEMRRGGGGAIVNIASVMGLVGLPHTPAYSAAKGGVVQLTKVAALENAAHHIRVNCLCPGMIDTPMVQRIPPAGRDDFVARQALHRLGTAEEVAAAAVFLAGDAASFITGAALVIDGGYTAQ